MTGSLRVHSKLSTRQYDKLIRCVKYAVKMANIDPDKQNKCHYFSYLLVKIVFWVFKRTISLRRFF